MTITQQHLSGHQILSQEYTPLSHHLHHNGLVSHSSYGHPHHHGIHHPQLLQQHPQALLTNSLHAQSQMHQSIHAPFLRQVSQPTPLSKTPVISSIAPQVPSSVVAIAPPISNSSVNVSPLTVASSTGSHSLSASPLSPVTSLENISYTPSKVIHFRNVLSEITSNDLLNLCAPFGKVTHVLLLKNNQALVQFSDINCAVQFIQYYGSAASQKHLEKEKEELLLKTGDSNGTTTGELAKLKQLGPIPTQFVGKNQAQIKGVNVYPNFSSHQELSKGSLHSTVVTVSNSSVAVPDMMTNSFQENEKKNRIILVTIYNSQFAVINVDVLQQVFSYYGLIEKIVMFNKTAGLQALIQYKQTQDAAQAKAQLNGQYLSWPDGNSCNLSIQFSNLQDLTVHQNSDRARDFTKPNLPTENNPMPSLFSQGPYSQWYPTNTNNQTSMQLRDSEKAVLLVSNFNEKQLDCDKIFNLFSCYGYVVRIKIFRSKADHALVQMANHFQANTAIACLKGLEIFGKKLSVNFSKHTHINANDSNDQLTKDYSKTMLNRFPKNMTNPQGNTSPQNGTSSGAAAGDKKNRFMCQPTNTLHIFNIDNDVSDKDLTDLFAECGEIEGIRRFIHNNKHMALIKFKTIQAAVIALCTFHNFQFKTLPLKISFSTNKL